MDQTLTPARAAPLPAVCLRYKGMPPPSAPWWGWLLQSSPQKDQMKGKSRCQHRFKCYRSILNRKEGDHSSGLPVGFGFWKKCSAGVCLQTGRFLKSLSEGQKEPSTRAIAKWPWTEEGSTHREPFVSWVSYTNWHRS